jgi:hypothetical protein
MNAGKIRTAFVFTLLACCLTAFAAKNVRANLTPKEARKAITRMAGFELKNGSVRVKTVSALNAAEAEVSAEIRTVFKFALDQQGRWRIAEIRTGQDRWEEIDLIASALGKQVVTGACTAPDPPARGSQALDPSIKRVRCLLGNLLGVEIPSDAVRIQEVGPMAVPLSSQPSATVVAWVKVDARLLNDTTGWHVAELRTGNREWVKLEPIAAALNAEKQRKARAEMELVAKALEKYRKDRGFYVVSDSQAVAIDHLSPRYLAQVIRLDPWHQPYKYQGERDRFTLRSAGPDGKEDTSDDIRMVISSR